MARVQLIAGLGNPGAEYEHTRHNVGFWFVDAVAQAHAASFKREAKFFGDACRISIGGDSVWLLKPQTYMNRSGQSIAALTSFYKIPADSVLVVHDELDLPVGVVRLKIGGGHGGHNGLRSTVDSLGSSAFLRLRIGIGHPGDRSLVTNYVLGRASRGDETQMRAAMDDAITQLPAMVQGHLDKVMQTLHTAK